MENREQRTVNGGLRPHLICKFPSNVYSRFYRIQNAKRFPKLLTPHY